jgi:hypothetical protein
MASLIKKPNGSRQIQYVDDRGKRRTIHIGHMQGKQADSVLVRVETLISAKSGNTAIDAVTNGWVNGLSDTLHERPFRVGLVPPRAEPHVIISQLFDRYFARSRSSRQPRRTTRRPGPTSTVISAMTAKSYRSRRRTPKARNRMMSSVPSINSK